MSVRWPTPVGQPSLGSAPAPLTGGTRPGTATGVPCRCGRNQAHTEHIGEPAYLPLSRPARRTGSTGSSGSRTFQRWRGLGLSTSSIRASARDPLPPSGLYALEAPRRTFQTS